MKILKVLKKFLGHEIEDEKSFKDIKNEEQECLIEDNITEFIENKREVYTSFAQKLSAIRRDKYIQSSMSLSNKFECEILEYLLAREDFNFNVYWNAYVPDGKNKYIKIDNIIITGDTVYIIECKDLRTCIGIKDLGSSWKYYYENKKDNKAVNLFYETEKYIKILKEYLGINNYQFKSIIALVVSDKFSGYLEADNICLVRNKERNVLFKLLDKKIIKLDTNIDECFVKINSRVYECMNPVVDIIDTYNKK
ncbi:MAG: nuclease-related domain-containing protein [Sarcina sp.]